jgi:uncharacterized protein YycO
MKLIFTRSPSFAGHLIRAFEGGDWDHVGIVDDEHVIEATVWHGVRRRTLASMRAGTRHELVEVACDPRLESAALAWARGQVGKPYDFGAVVGFLFWRSTWARQGAWYCSEAAAYFAVLCGLTLAGNHRRIGVRLMHALSHAWGPK